MSWEEYLGVEEAVAMVSPDGWFLKANRACCSLLGYSEEELTKLRVRDITHPDDRPQSVALVDRALSQEERPWDVIK
ncbi:MAG: PAS domain S-box protein, partial [Candidatus Eremiobacteraeota bacterium]|nr:PAS domain S-box protein [Candidatus Eremiobacteraeota bacterium]